MSLNNIELSGFSIGELYKDALLVDPDASPAPPRPSSSPTAAVPPVQKPAAIPSATTPSAATPSATAPSAVTPAPAPPTTAPAPIPTAQQQKPAVAPPPAPQPTPAQPVATTPPQAPAASGETYKFLGNHRRKVTILVNTPGITFLPDNQLNFLIRILEACRMNIGDVAIVNHATLPVNITALRSQLQPSVILLFGLEPVTIRLPINFPVFKLQPYDDCTYLSAPPLEQMVAASEDSRLLKSKLWGCLKTLFDV